MDEYRPSPISRDLRELRSSTLRVVEGRESLPKTLFWSLFLTEISEIKHRKHKEQLIRSLFVS